MRHFSILILLFLISYSPHCKGQIADSISYESQRKRVNALLEERSRKFGDFDTSLEKKTGLFGILKSKKDMQKSIDILKQIVITDNNIFLETRKLLTLKDNEHERLARLAEGYDEQITAHMRTISKLQERNKILENSLHSESAGLQKNNSLLYVACFIIVLLILIYVFKIMPRLKAHK